MVVVEVVAAGGRSHRWVVPSHREVKANRRRVLLHCQFKRAWTACMGPHCREKAPPKVKPKGNGDRVEEEESGQEAEAEEVPAAKQPLPI